MIRFFVLLHMIVFAAVNCWAQQAEQPEDEPLRVAVVAPVYIDSAFDGGLIKKSLPRYMTAGLEFVQGAELAFDTLNTNNRKVEAFIIDTRAKDRNLRWAVSNGSLDKMNLIIGGVREPEFSELAQFARQKRIPFVSAIYPNDGGITKDSFLIIMNSTLKTNVNGIYSYIVQQHSMDQILVLKQPNDNRIDDLFRAFNRQSGKNLLKMKTIAVDSIDAGQLAMLIDTLKPAVVIGASLDESFALNIADACYPYKNKITLIGMPNWDGFRELYNKERFADFPILYTTPHYDQQDNALGDFLGNQYFTKYRSRPGDMATKGFEATYYFTNILLHFGGSFLEHLNENAYAVFHEFNFKPTALTEEGTVDYYENRHVFIVRVVNGTVSRIW